MIDSVWSMVCVAADPLQRLLQMTDVPGADPQDRVGLPGHGATR